MESLSVEKLSKVKEFPSNMSFRFGDGITLKSIKKIILPCNIAKQECMLQTDVVSSDIPLLLGKPSMKLAKVKLDIGNDKVSIFGKDIPVYNTVSGHYCIPLMKSEENTVFVKQTLLTTADYMNKKNAILKLHRQFAHPSSHRLKLLLKDAGYTEENYMSLVDEITDECNICMKYKRTPPRPVTCIPIARDFNEVVTIDLKVWDKR